MIRAFLHPVTGILLFAAWIGGIVVLYHLPTPPAKTETLSCVRVKQVTPAGAINYLCEVRK